MLVVGPAVLDLERINEEAVTIFLGEAAQHVLKGLILCLTAVYLINSFSPYFIIF